jgi:hypothetical protein
MQKVSIRLFARRVSSRTAKAGGAVAIAATAVLGGLALASGPAGALGPPLSVPTQTAYTSSCSVLGIINFPVTVTTFAAVPGGTSAGGTVNLQAFRSTVTVPASFVDLGISLLGLTSLNGQLTTVDINATNTTNGTVNAVPTPEPFSVTLTEGQPANVTLPTTPATVGPWTAGNIGTITYTPGELAFSVSALGLSIPIVCTPESPAPAFGTTAIH